MQDNPDMQILARSNLQGYYMDYLIRAFCEPWLDSDQIQTTFLDTGDLCSELLTQPTKESSVVIAVGLPFHESQRNTLDSAMENTADNPFSLVYHFATFGDTYRNDSAFRSFVDTEISPVGNLYQVLPELQSFFHYLSPDYVENFLVKYATVIDTIDKYNRYELLPNTMDYVELGLLYQSELSRYSYQKASDLLDSNFYVLKALHNNRVHYIKKALEKVKAQVINSTVVCFLFAERYTNEIAHELLAFYQRYGYAKIVVFVGKHTRGEDCFSMRTVGVNAGELAKEINKGRGKEKTATVFLGEPITATYNALLNLLPNIL